MSIEQQTQQSAGQEGSHFFVLTLEKRDQPSLTAEGTCTPHPGSTRQSVYRMLYDAVTAKNPRMAGAVVTFFLVEPNRL